MTDHDALLRAILERPADDAPRLIFADWLEENGQARRAKFIRDQIRHPPHEPINVFRQTLSGRGQWTKMCNLPVWDLDFGRVTTPSAVAVSNTGRSSVGWDRGFVSRLLLPSFGQWTATRWRGVIDRHPITSVWSVNWVLDRMAQLDKINAARRDVGLSLL